MYTCNPVSYTHLDVYKRQVTGGSVGTMASIVTWTWQQKKSGSLRSFNKELITGLDKKLKNQTLTVTDVHTSSKRTPSPGLYDLTELQRDANKRFGFSAKETLNIMQSLYEHHKVCLLYTSRCV